MCDTHSMSQNHLYQFGIDFFLAKISTDYHLWQEFPIFFIHIFFLSFKNSNKILLKYIYELLLHL